MISRRRALGLLAAAGAGTLTGTLFGPRAASAQAGAPVLLANADMRGAIDAADHGIVPGAADDQSKRFAAILAKAASRNAPVFLPPGNYHISNLDLPEGTRITGVPGASRLVYSGDGHFMRADGKARIELSNLVIDGANRWLADYAPALLHLRATREVIIDNCEIAGARRSAIRMERCGGRIERSRISGAGDAAIHALESTNLSITGNVVTDCGNGGILVHRWTKGHDGSMIVNNRVQRIAARNGGTGQYGNGINIFRADNVMVSGNHVSGCAFSAIRANAASNIQISGNQCLASGETALYSEFGFEGALVSGNLIDGAANGISIVNFNEGGRLAAVTGNIVRNLRGDGPYPHESIGFGVGIAAEADTVVSGNVVENAARWGIQLGWGPYLRNVLASGNIVRQATLGIGVSVVEGTGHTVISDNLFDATPEGAIAGFRWAERVTGELAEGGHRFPNLTIERNRTS